MRIVHAHPLLYSFQLYKLLSYLLSNLTVLAANIFSDSVLFRASRNDYSSLTQRDLYYCVLRMTSAGVIYVTVLLLSNCDIIIVFIIRLLSLTFYRRAVLFSRCFMFWYIDAFDFTCGKVYCCYNFLT